jgi:eukaryotic-like serine/threonine-protein kinase
MQQQVGRYKMLRQLGKGAMGVVYLADDPLLNRQVAIKTIDLAIEDATRREFLRGRLLRDARAAASLSHANIVGVYDIVEDGDCACIVMEYVDGENLASYLSRNPVADSQFTAHVIRAMATALDYTHKRGIIHRDIKPANVMLDSTRTPKITDFGIARLAEGATTTMTGTVMGTIEYMAPEQVKGKAVDGRADQFALGVVAYRMLTGSTLYGEQSMATMAYKIVNELPAPARSRNSWLPPGVDPVLAKALAKDPNNRYRNCSEFSDALASALTGVDREAPTVAMARPAGNKGRRNRRLVMIAAGATAAIAGLSIARPWELLARQTPAAVAVSKLAETKPVENKSSQQAVAPPVEKPMAEEASVRKAVANTPAKPQAKPQKAAEAKAAPVEPPAGVLPDLPASQSSADPASDALNRGKDLMKNNRFAEAVQAFTKAADIRSSWVQAYLGRGNAYQKLEQFDAAIRDYSRAIRLDPKNFQGYLSRAQSYVRTEQDEPALADLNQAITLKPEAPAALLARGEVYRRKKDYEKAIADFSEAIRVAPENANAYRGRAAARRAKGDRPGAQSDREKAKEIAEKKGEKGG